MHIYGIVLFDAKPIEELEWTLLSNNTSGWHVFLGNNGSGKSTIIKSISLCLIGPNNCQYLHQNWSKWIRKNSNHAQIGLLVQPHSIDKFTKNTREEVS